MAEPFVGVLLAGGSATRFHPTTQAVSKHLLPVYDKPLVYYPLCTLMLAGLREVLVVSGPEHLPGLRRLLGDGRRWGIHIDYVEQAEPLGVAHGLALAAAARPGRPLAMVLGDNILYAQGLARDLQAIAAAPERNTVFAYRVRDPAAFGVVELDAQGRPVAVHEKPEVPPTDLAVPGLYFYSAAALERLGDLQPSARGELEVSAFNQVLIDAGVLEVRQLGRGVAWLDAGTPEGLLDAALFIRTIEERQGLKIACPEEVAWRMGMIDDAALAALAAALPAATAYRQYLERQLDGGR